MRDEQRRDGAYELLIPEVTWTESHLSLAQTHGNAIRPTITIALVRRLSISLPVSVAGSQATPTAGGQHGHIKGMFFPTPRKHGNAPAMPGYKDSLITADEVGVKSVIPITGATQTLIDAWVNGLGGVKPVNGQGQFYTACEDGRLVSK